MVDCIDLVLCLDNIGLADRSDLDESGSDVFDLDSERVDTGHWNVGEENPRNMCVDHAG